MIAKMIIYFLFILTIACVPVRALHTCGSFPAGLESLPPFTHISDGFGSMYTYTLHPNKKIEQYPYGQSSSKLLVGTYSHSTGTGNDIIHHYTNGKADIPGSKRQATVSFECERQITYDIVTKAIENPQYTYTFTVLSPACCPLSPPPPPLHLCGTFADPSSISFGAYTLLPGQQVTISQAGATTASLGTYEYTAGTGVDQNQYYTNGRECSSGSTQTIVSFVCRSSASEQIVQGFQESACTHRLTILSAACCVIPTPPPPPILSCEVDPLSLQGVLISSKQFQLRIGIGEFVQNMNGGSLGTYSSTHMGNTVQQHYTGGETDYICGPTADSVPYGHHSSVVNFKCGLTRQMVGVTHETACNKVIILEMPECCTISELNELHAAWKPSTTTGGTSSVDVEADMGMTSTSTSTTDVGLPVAVNVTSSPDMTVSIDTTSPTDVTLPVDSTSSTDVTLPVDITSAPHVTLNLHLDHKGDNGDGMDSSTNAVVVIVWLVMSMVCCLVVVYIVYNKAGDTGTPEKNKESLSAFQL